MAVNAQLSELPKDISQNYLPFQLTSRQKTRAEAFCLEKYVNNVKILKKVSEVFDVFASVYRSQRKSEKPHDVSFEIKEKKAVDAYCSCKAGISGECSHVVAVIFTLQNWQQAGLQDIPADPSCTSLPQQWNKPRGARIDPEPITSMIIAKPRRNLKRRPVMATFEDNRKCKKPALASDREYLKQAFENRPFGYLVEEVTNNDANDEFYIGSLLSHQAPLIGEKTVPSETNISCWDLALPRPINFDPPESVEKYRHEWQDVSISISDAQNLERSTAQQAHCALWFSERRKRITSSQFGLILRRKLVNSKFVESIFDSKPFSSSPTSYGISNEPIARQLYIKKTGNHVHQCGFVVSPDFPFLGATPDGKVCCEVGKGILEIKCPYAIRDMTFQQALSSKKKDLCLEISESGAITLRTDHPYYAQVQGQLMVTGVNFCDFVCFTKTDLFIQRIYPDFPFIYSVLETLTVFYSKYGKGYCS